MITPGPGAARRNGASPIVASQRATCRALLNDGDVVNVAAILKREDGALAIETTLGKIIAAERVVELL